MFIGFILSIEWATCIKRSHDQSKQLSKNKSQKWKENIKILQIFSIFVYKSEALLF